MKVGSQIKCTECVTPHRGKIVAVLTADLFGVAWNDNPNTDAVFRTAHAKHLATAPADAVQLATATASEPCPQDPQTSQHQWVAWSGKLRCINQCGAVQ